MTSTKITKIKIRAFAIVVVLFFVIGIKVHVGFCADGSSLSVSPSDYSNAANWLAMPTAQSCSADVIYFYPTVYTRTSPDVEPVISDINNKGMRTGAADIFKKQATAFETAADIFAPYYRQADGVYALALSTDEKDALLSGAPLADAEAALDYYFDHYNNGRPYILAGHSQGSTVLRLLVADYMPKHPDRYKRMVAAYIIGYSIDKKYLAENPHLKFAERSDDTGVIISYNTEAVKVTGNDPVWLEGSISINPISWTRGDTEALSGDNLGSLTKELAGSELSLDVPGIANARLNLERGTVICSTVEQSKYEMPNGAPYPFGTGIYHTWDYGFYYMNIRQNAKDRINAFLEQTKKQKTNRAGCGIGMDALALLAAIPIMISMRKRRKY